MPKPKLTLEDLLAEAAAFARTVSGHDEPSLYGVTDGKAIGTYVEQRFQDWLAARFDSTAGSSARGRDLPELNIDIKVTRASRPQSSCPFRSARQKIYGLGYSLLVFVYDKEDDPTRQTGRLSIVSAIFVDAAHTADFQTTKGIQSILENEGNADDLVAFMHDRYLPVDDVQAWDLANEVLGNPPPIGYLTISNALQWRLHYNRALALAGEIAGLVRVV